MGKRLVIVVLSAAVIGAVALWFTSRFEYRSETVQTGPQGPARTNPYLALERLLGQTGVEVAAAATGLDTEALPPVTTTLFIPGARHDTDPTRARRLIEWVRDGGRLVLRVAATAEHARHDDGSLLTQVGIRPRAAAQSGSGQDASPPDAYQVQLNGGPPSRLHLSNAAWLEYEGPYPVTWAVTDENDKLLAVELRLGAGRFIAFNDTDFLSNSRIGNHDHAYIALRLLGPAANDAVWIAHNIHIPPLLELLRRHAWPALLALALLIGAWLAHAGARLGPLKQAASPERRSLMEHIQAAARFLWRRGQADILVRSSREATLARLRQAQPAWSRLAQPQLWEHLAALSDLDSEDVRFAFTGMDTDKEAEFIRTMRILQTIDKALR